MTKTLTSVFGRIAKLFRASDRGRKLQRHGDLAHQFALIAPLGGGAIVAFQALHLPESDDATPGPQPRRRRPALEMGLVAGA
jgi:hypothetical protein